MVAKKHLLISLILLTTAVLITFFVFKGVVVNSNVDKIEQQLVQKEIGLFDALEKLNLIVKKNPKNTNALVSLAKIYVWTEDYDRAFEFYNVALKLKPKNTNILSDLVRLNIVTFNFVEAEKLLNRILDLKTEGKVAAKAYLDLGIMKESQQKTEEALAFYDKAISNDPTLAEALVQKGFLELSILGNIKDVQKKTRTKKYIEEILQKALLINPNLTSTYVLSFMIGAYDGNKTRMAEMKKKSLEVLPNDSTLNIVEKQKMLNKINTLSTLKVLTQEEYEKLKNYEQ